MKTIHNFVAKFRKYPFAENEGLLILGVDDNAVSSYCHFRNKALLLDALLRVFKKNPALLAVVSDAVKFASVSSDEKKKLEPRLQKFLDKILKDLEDMGDKNL